MRKRRFSEIDAATLVEPQMSRKDWSDYAEGWRLFNDGQFWHAHESWETVWKRTNDDSRIFFQGIIQLAAAYYLVTEKKRFGGAMKNLQKAEEKLRLFPEEFLGVSVPSLLMAIGRAKSEMEILGENRLHQFDRAIIPCVVPGELRGARTGM